MARFAFCVHTELNFQNETFQLVTTTAKSKKGAFCHLAALIALIGEIAFSNLETLKLSFFYCFPEQS